MTKNSVALVLVFLVILTACQQERQPCLEPKLQSLIMGAYHAGDTNGVVTITSISLGSPYIGPVNSNSQSPIYNGVLSTGHSFSLFLSSVSDSCRYYIQRDTVSAMDTLSFFYQSQLHFLSNACGYTYFYTLQSLSSTHHNIDSVILENNSITTNVNVEHIKVYFMEL